MSVTRTAIRHLAANLLQASGTVAATSVFREPTGELKQDEYPAMVVFPKDEEVTEPISSHPPEYERAFVLVVESRAKGNNGLYDRLESMADTADQVMHGLPLAGEPRLVRVVLQGAEYEIDDEADPVIGRLRHTYLVVYDA